MSANLQDDLIILSKDPWHLLKKVCFSSIFCMWQKVQNGSIFCMWQQT